MQKVVNGYVDEARVGTIEETLNQPNEKAAIQLNCRLEIFSEALSTTLVSFNPDFPLALYCGRATHWICARKDEKQSVTVE